MVARLVAPLLLELDRFLALQWRILGAVSRTAGDAESYHDVARADDPQPLRPRQAVDGAIAVRAWSREPTTMASHAIGRYATTRSSALNHIGAGIM